MFATKKLITGLNDDPCFLTILIKIDLATLYVDSDLESWKIYAHYHIIYHLYSFFDLYSYIFGIYC